MVKTKGAATVMGIILLSVFAWVVLIVFVIQPNMWVGSALSLSGGAAIGGGVGFLMRRWSFKGILRKEE